MGLFIKMREERKTMSHIDVSSALDRRLLLLTGLPGIGKTTVIRKVVNDFDTAHIAGFITEEIRSRNLRQGFRLVPFHGRSSILAHIHFPSPHRVGKYGVDIAALEDVAEEILAPDPLICLFIIDEIGKMECMSPAFIEAIEALLDSDKVVLATVALKGGSFIREVKERVDAELWTITRQNRDQLPRQIADWLKERLPGLGVPTRIPKR